MLTQRMKQALKARMELAADCALPDRDVQVLVGMREVNGGPAD